jgi:predicted nucleotidyltransferase
MHHHLGLVHKAYRAIGDEPVVKLKKYFYILRSLLSAAWIRTHQTVPPMTFEPLSQLLEPHLYPTVETWRQLKAESVEATTVPRLVALHEYIEAEIAASEAFAQTLPPHTGPIEPLNALFRRWIEG